MEVVDFVAQAGFEISYKYPQPERNGSFLPHPAAFRQEITDYAKREYPGGLYRHQAIAMEKALKGKDLVICTGTASGKTIAFALPVFDAILEDPGTRAMFFYPTKALAGDQFEKLENLAGQLGLDGRVCRFDGDVSQSGRNEALQKGRLLLCTPDVLHATLLRRNKEPVIADVFGNLKYVVLDECHTYSGAFGSNMAFLMRRLRQVCRNHGAGPQFLAASATSKDPARHLEMLTGKKFDVVSEEDNGCPTGGRTFLLADGGTGKSILDFIAGLVGVGKNFIVFCHSRRLTEQYYTDLIQSCPGLEGKVMPYRSGYEADDRRNIEDALRKGRLLGVISTSALELGIDLPDLEVCILLGLPPTAMSFWQRAGRVGRRQGSKGTVVVFPSDNTIDDYYRIHPDKLFGREMENLVVHLDNRQLIISHYACARVESNDFDAPQLDADIFSEDFVKLTELVNQMDITDNILVSQEPHKDFGIRGIDDRTYEIYTAGGEARLGTINWSQVLREAYPRAVYRHMGDAFRVEKVNFREGTIKVKREKRQVSTSPVGYIVVKEMVGSGGTIYRKTNWSDLMEMWHTTVTVTTLTSGYRERLGNNWINQEKYLQPLQRRVLSEGVWLKLTGNFGPCSREALNALAHAIGNVYTICQPCDPAEMATHSVFKAREGCSYIYIFDTTSGGMGLTSGVFDHFPELLDMARERLCVCEHCDSDPESFDRGCPACIQVPRWYEDNEKLSKKAALELLERIEQVVRQNAPKVIVTEDYEHRIRGGLTAVSNNRQITSMPPEEEIVIQTQRFGKRVFKSGSMIALLSGQKGTVLEYFLENGSVSYLLEKEDGRRIKIRDIGSLTLLEGSETVLCLVCGSTGLDFNEKECPACGAVL